MGAPHVGERTEKQLISAFCKKIAELTPQLMTFAPRPHANQHDLDCCDATLHFRDGVILGPSRTSPPAGCRNCTRERSAGQAGPFYSVTLKQVRPIAAVVRLPGTTLTR